MSQILVGLPNWEFSRSARFMVTFKLAPDQPLLSRQRKVYCLDIKLAITRLVYEITPRFLYQSGGFRVGQCNGIIQTGPNRPLLPYDNEIFLTFPQKFGVCKTSKVDHHVGLCHAF